LRALRAAPGRLQEHPGDIVRAVDIPGQPEPRDHVIPDRVEHGLSRREVPVQRTQGDARIGRDLRQRDVVGVVVIQPGGQRVEDRFPDDGGLPVAEAAP